MGKIITVAEIAKKLKLSDRAVTRYITDGFRGVKLHATAELNDRKQKKWIIDSDDFDTFMKRIKEDNKKLSDSGSLRADGRTVSSNRTHNSDRHNRDDIQEELDFWLDKMMAVKDERIEDLKETIVEKDRVIDEKNKEINAEKARNLLITDTILRLPGGDNEYIRLNQKFNNQTSTNEVYEADVKKSNGGEPTVETENQTKVSKYHLVPKTLLGWLVELFSLIVVILAVAYTLSYFNIV